MAGAWMRRLVLPLSVGVRGLKSDLPPAIKWIRPEVVPCTRASKSGDLEAAPLPPRDAPCPQYRNAPALHTLEGGAKRLLSVGFCGGAELRAAALENLEDRVRRHAYDDNSFELNVARMTAEIRLLQLHLDVHPKDGEAVNSCKILIDKRKKWLKRVRRIDYKRFEWLLEKLQIEYKPQPLRREPVTRKRSLFKLTGQYCARIRETKKQAFRLELLDKREKLLKMYAEDPLPQPNYQHRFPSDH